MTLEEVIKVLETMPAADRFFDFGRFAAEHGWKAASGATKFCYIIPDADFVIKFCRNNKRHNECEQEARAYQSGKSMGLSVFCLKPVLCMKVRMVLGSSCNLRFLKATTE